MYSLPISFPARVDRVDLSHHWEACGTGGCCQTCGGGCCCERFAGYDSACAGCVADRCVVDSGGAWVWHASLGRGDSVLCLCSGQRQGVSDE
jgi:hypothetical protein